MGVLLFLGGALYLGALGFFLMGRIDRFLDRGGFFSHGEDGGAQDPPPPTGPRA